MSVAGYSGTPLPRKLGIKPGARLGLARAPADFSTTLGELPDGVVVRDAVRGQGPFDVIVCFVQSHATLVADLAALKNKLDPAGGLWLAWRKKTSGKPSPTKAASGASAAIGESSVRAEGLAAGLVDNKVCAIDETWSGLRFVVRLVDRPSDRPSAVSVRPRRRAKP